MNNSYEDVFTEAEQLLKNNQDQDAEEKYLLLYDKAHKELSPIVSFRLGEIYNRKKWVKESSQFHTNAFLQDPLLANKLIPETHPMYHFNYLSFKESEHKVTACPLCSLQGELHSCYNSLTNVDFVQGFNPVRIWMQCRSCNHIFAHNYPIELNKILTNSSPELYFQQRVETLPIIGDIFSNIKRFSKGSKLLDIGTGAGEMAAVAKEFLYSITGVEIRPVYAKHVSDTLEIPIVKTDIMHYETNELYDVIILGDIIEHTPEPLKVLKKVRTLLKKDGILWISTPNFESGYTAIMKDKDAMWRVCEHVNYFSYTSLLKALEISGFVCMEYSASKRFYGSMELIVTKQ
ncbi:class I SAM-dependent methyltransferase [Bacillus sp. SM2101]|uniref:class I SAM-dependent methyltransferase n=1 Tax=Bacillus sp. SM2101 TaxID=2805366 RepID=UPI001BDF4F3D|nr:class I SAM-dependent methyltransferase [Bacillus sp. SM2101]